MRSTKSLILLIAFAALFAYAMEAGMTGDSYWKAVAGNTKLPAGKTRIYYVSADEVEWDYAPLGYNGYTGQPFGPTENTYVKAGQGYPGSKYKKCLYRGYTDKSYTNLQQRPASEAYLGMMGPTIRAEVGDIIKVYFRNNCSIPVSVHVHGVFYNKDSEGAGYNDGTSGKDKVDDAVAPNGGLWLYTWNVPERAGPGPHDGSSVMWMYHSHVDDVKDIYAGMMGNMVITGKGFARADGTPKDVDVEMFATFTVQDEGSSPYIAANVAKYALPGPNLGGPFAPNNQMHVINGYIYGSQPLMQMHKGDRVRWYVMGMGGFFDMHTPHWHGNTVVMSGMRMDVISLLPFTMVTVDMVPDAVGIWFFHCHVVTHMDAGMMTRYEVLP